MRVRSLLSLAFGLIAVDTVVASRCKPRSSETSSAASLTTSSISTSFTTESLPSDEPTSTTEAFTLTKSLALTTSSIPEESSTTTDSFTTEEYASSTESVTLDLSSTFATSFMTTTSSDSTTAETSTSEPTTTTSTGPFDPIPTFNIVAVSGPVPNAQLRSTGEYGNILTFNPTYSGTHVLSFSLDHSTGRVRESNGKYMCELYQSSLAFVSLCDSESTDAKFLTCKVKADLTLSCTGPEGHKYYDDEGESTTVETGGTVDKFYVKWEGYGYYSEIGPSGVAGAINQAVGFGLQQAG